MKKLFLICLISIVLRGGEVVIYENDYQCPRLEITTAGINIVECIGESRIEHLFRLDDVMQIHYYKDSYNNPIQTDTSQPW